ncbi:4-coumarate--CoA ligase-like 7 [Contarinia nasturtii]|uniref:4-coumarate--CoA ligase-like 7 n=1 Tax=Contarinia nasturtii TaxID=265458 RepID=UPI0012D40ACF|nr:4-coumarate--CoA ligase-like 7 [Contarinia nasturtii]
MFSFATSFDKKLKLWSGRDIFPLYHPDISVAQVMLGALKNYGPKIAQISDDNGTRLSFDEIRMKTVRAAQNLQKREYKSKQVFGLVAKNSQHLAPIIFASMCLGCPINTLGISFKKTEIIHMLKITKPVLMFCDIEMYDLLKECLLELGNKAKILTFGGSKGDSEPVENLFLKTKYENDFIPVKVDGKNEAAVIVCSSGTTGLPKCAGISHAALLDAVNRFNIGTFSDVILSFGLVQWINGLRFLLRGTLCGATRIITTDIWSPELELSIIEKYQVTIAMNASYHICLLMESEHLKTADLSSLNILMIGGSKVPTYLRNGMNNHLSNGKVHDVYGMSEIACVAALDYPGLSGKETVGQLANGIHIKIIDDEGNRCGIGENGEICIKTNYKFLGYYGNEIASNDIFDEEDFIMSGDIGHFDENGYLYVVDRKKDIFKYCGSQVSPSEIEAFLIESKDIKLVCVVGIPDPDQVAGDLPAAVIVRANGSNISEKEVLDMVAGHFADQCKLRGGVYFVDSLPITQSAKVLRRIVKETTIKRFNARKN